MIDVIFRMESGFDLGKVEKIKGNTVTILKEEWAPAIWAGSEGMEIYYGRKKYNNTVVSVNLDTREIEFEHTVGMKVNDILRLK